MRPDIRFGISTIRRGYRSTAGYSPKDVTMLQKVLSYDVNVVSKFMLEFWPETWKRCFTKSIDAPGNYYSSKAIAVSLTCAIEESRFQNKLESNGAIAAGILEKYDYPTYYVSEPLVEAIKRTHPPVGITWQDLKLPFPAMCFMVPRGSLKEPEEVGGRDVIFLGIASLPVGELFSIPTVGRLTESVTEDRTTIFWAIAPSGICITDTTFPTSHPLEPISDWIDAATEKSNREYVGPSTDFCVRMAGLIANFILLMEARKELVEPGKCLTKKVGKGRLGIYSPTFIGRNYRILRKDEGPREAKGHFTELGWRAGHWKTVHVGKGRVDVKRAFVDPYIAFTRGLQPVEFVIGADLVHTTVQDVKGEG